MTAKHILIAVAWPYANGPRHIGHVAGFGVPSDIFARYHRAKGNHVLMVSGTDEHGTPITVQAEQEGVSPKALVDRYSQVIRDDLCRLGLSYDLFTRTTTDNHCRITQDFFRTLHEKGYIFKKESLGAFSADSGNTLPDRYIEGTCPYCSTEGARGDQCDSCGKQLDPVELIEPRSKIDGKPPVFKESEHFFLNLPAFVPVLQEWIAAQPHWRANVRSFSLNLVNDLQPRPITRDMQWGIAIPLPEYIEQPNKRIYVWFDAVIGYLSASIEWAHKQGDPECWREWWQNPTTEHYYFMGKDNLVFHTIIWPSMLAGFGNGVPNSFAAQTGESLRLPHNVVSSEFLTMEGKKFSSSRGVVIYVNDFLDRYSADSLRFFLTIAGPENQDTDFTWKEFVRRNNDELVANWGNLVNRVLSMTHKHFGKVPEPAALTEADQALLDQMAAGFDSVGEAIAQCSFKFSLETCLRLTDAVNRYLSDTAPWQLLKADQARAATVLYVALCCINHLKILFSPFLPFSCQSLHHLLGFDDVLCPMPQQEIAHWTPTDNNTTHKNPHQVISGDYALGANHWHPPLLKPHQPLPAPAPLFEKLDEHVADAEVDRLAEQSK